MSFEEISLRGFPESWRWWRRRRRKRTKNNKSPGYPGWLNKNSCNFSCLQVSFISPTTRDAQYTRHQPCMRSKIWWLTIDQSLWGCVDIPMITSSNGNIFHVTGPLWGDSLTKASDAELWHVLFGTGSVPEQTHEQTIEMPVILWRHCNALGIAGLAISLVYDEKHLTYV